MYSWTLHEQLSLPLAAEIYFDISLGIFPTGYSSSQLLQYTFVANIIYLHKSNPIIITIIYSIKHAKDLSSIIARGTLFDLFIYFSADAGGFS